MSHPTATINGCSLEDCHTNLFALTDLAGIRWRKYIGESGYCAEPLDDHVLASFTRCIKSDILCVWRRGQKTNEPRASDQLACKKELWVFWYGQEPSSLSNLVSSDLHFDRNDEGAWEGDGMPYECRTLLFKALHNLIERCLQQQNFVRIGKWFVQPFDQRHLHDKGAHLSIRFSFFLHGESTVCASIDVRQHPPLWRTQAYHLNVATQAGQTGLPVVLAPYGLAGTLTGQAYKDTDLSAQKVLADWQEFYVLSDQDVGRCAKVVEVIVGGVRMRYPASFILIADDTQQEIIRQHGGHVPNPSPAALTPPSSPRVPRHTQGEPAIKLMAKAAYVDNTYLPAVSVDGGEELSARLVDKVWMDAAIASGAQPLSRLQQSEAGSDSDPTLGCWECGDPCHKHSCGCSMHKGKRSSQNKGGPSPSKHGSKSDKALDKSRQPFHRRNTMGDPFLQHEVDYLMQSLPAKSVGSFKPLLPGSNNNSGIGTPSMRSQPTPGQASTPVSSSTNTAVNSASTNAGTPAAPSANSSFEQPNSLSAPAAPAGADSPHSAAPSPLVASQPSQPAASHNGDPTMPTLSPHPPSTKDKDAQGQPQVSNASAPQTSDIVNGGTHLYMNGIGPVESSGKIPAHLMHPQMLSKEHTPYRTNSTPAEVCVKTEPVNSWLETQQHKSLGGGSAGIKKPNLPVKQYDENDEELIVNNLYNFDSLHAWLDLPVKRQRMEEEGFSGYNNGLSSSKHKSNVPSPQQPEQDPYEFSDELSLSPTLKKRRTTNYRSQSREDGLETSIKEEPMSPTTNGDETVGGVGGFSGLSEKDLLNPQMGLLDNIFDTSDSESNDGGCDNFPVPTPPPNKDETKLPSGLISKSGLGGPSGSLLACSRLEQSGPSHTELCRMFPTPPSHENIHNALSPCNGPDMAGTDLTVMDTGVKTTASEYMYKRMMLGDDSVKDWSFVYRPPLVVEFVSSNKYAPIDLPSSKVEPLTIAVPEYHPSWQQFHLPIIEKQPQPPQSHYTNVPSVEPAPHTSSQRHRDHAPTTPVAMERPAGSPAASFQGNGPPSSQQQRTPRTPMSYELQSPASNASSSYPNKHSVGGPLTNCSMPEVHSLVVNIMLSDSLLNLFKDHNYDSCTICVCNNNIKGSDVGLYITDRSPEMQFPCQCGFSAVMNRKYSVGSGLFYEDEVDVSGIRDDRLEHRKPTLLAIQPKTEPCDSKDNKEDNSATHQSQGEVIPQELLLLLQGQFSSVYPSMSVTFNCKKMHHALEGVHNGHDTVNMLEVQDGCEACYMALEVGRQAMDNCSSAKLDDPVMKNTCIHKWPYLQTTAKIPANSQDVVRLLKSLQPLLQDAIQKKRTGRLWDHVYTITGPLSWKDFHLLAGRGSDETSEPQPIPPLLVGYDKDWMRLAPQALRYWDKLFIEPYGKQQNIAYIVVAPDNDFILSHVKSFTNELSRHYELCRMGKHRPVSTKLRDSILRVGKKEAKSLSELPIDEWFTHIGDSSVASKLRLYAQVCRHSLAPFINRAMVDDVSHLRSIFTDTPTSFGKSTRTPHYTSEPSPAPPHTPDSAGGGASGGEEKENDRDSGEATTAQQRYNQEADPDMDSEDLPAVVVYLIDPFSYSQDWEHLQRLATLGLLRCYQEMIKCLHESLNVNVQLQIIPLQSVLRYREDENTEVLKNLSLAVYTQCRRYVSHTVLGKSMTGFGPAAGALEILKRTKNEPSHINGLRLYTPPYVIAPVKESKINIASDKSTIEDSRVLLCGYCLSEDQRWLLAVCTDQKGELLETCTINIDIPNRNRRKKASARRIGLAKLWDFVMGVMTVTSSPWRVVIGRFGRIGHGELQGWSGLLSSNHLVACNKQLRESCLQCQVMPDPGPIILSACLVSMETHATIHIMPDSVKMEEEKLSSKIQMDTPRDASCTHILVVPTSSRAQANQALEEGGGGVDPHIGAGEFNEGEEDYLTSLLGIGGGDGMDETAGIMDEFGDLFAGIMENDQPGNKMDGAQAGATSPNLPGGGRHSPSGGRNSSHVGEDVQDSPLNLNQQPLAMGFYTSTAPTGPTPKWFWTACPHRENICPTSLKAALHVNSKKDDRNFSPKSRHPLDSSFTCDVLRYVLETYNALSWLTMDPVTSERRSCLPLHFVVLMQLYQAMNLFV